MNLTEATTLAEGRQRLSEQAFDVMAVALVLPDGDGLDLLDIPSPSGRPVPCVVLAEEAGLEQGLASLDRGAQDHLPRHAEPAALLRALHFAIRRSRAAVVDAPRRSILRATVDGVTGAEATVRDPGTGTSHRIRSDNRAVLLYLLARKLLEDRRAGKAEPDAGWLSDREIVIGIWGRGGEESGRNRLHVLVHRMRKELLSAGIESAVIESRRNALRGCFASIELF